MFKKDDVRKDFIIMCLIRLAAHLLKDSAPELSQSIVTYNVIPVSPSSGFVQFVPNSETVQKIIKQYVPQTAYIHITHPNDVGFAGRLSSNVGLITTIQMLKCGHFANALLAV